jgi:hypothetical protein
MCEKHVETFEKHTFFCEKSVEKFGNVLKFRKSSGATRTQRHEEKLGTQKGFFDLGVM